MGIEITRMGGNSMSNGLWQRRCPAADGRRSGGCRTSGMAVSAAFHELGNGTASIRRSMLVVAGGAGARASGSSSHCLLGLFDRVADPLERLGQVERLGQIGQPLPDQPAVFIGPLGQGQTVSAKLECHQPWAAAMGRVEPKEPSRFRPSRSALRESCRPVRPAAAPAPAAPKRVPGPPRRLSIGAYQQRGRAALVDQRLPDLLAVEERLQRRTVEDLLGPIGLDGGRAWNSSGRPAVFRIKYPPNRPYCECSTTVRNPIVGLDLESVTSFHPPFCGDSVHSRCADFPP